MMRRALSTCAVWLMLCVVASGVEWPSLFRGVAVADSPVGVRVVDIEQDSQAAMADLRPEDIIVRIRDLDIRSIDEFAVVSRAFKGKVADAPVLVFRNGAPKELRLHLYSYPVLQAWGVEVIPDFDLRFAEPHIALEHWLRMGRGFEDAGNTADALQSYVNALHHAPENRFTAAKLTVLSLRRSRQLLGERRLPEGISLLGQGVRLLERLFDQPIDQEELVAIREELRRTLEAVRGALAAQTAV